MGRPSLDACPEIVEPIAGAAPAGLSRQPRDPLRLDSDGLATLRALDDTAAPQIGQI